MGFLKKIFGGNDAKKEEKYVDKTGIYFFVQCDNCGTCVRLRADKQHDLLNDGGGFTWHKTIVDNKCFRQIPVVVSLNRNYEMTEVDIQGGKFISEEAYDAWLAEKNKPQQDPETEDNNQ